MREFHAPRVKFSRILTNFENWIHNFIGFFEKMTDGIASAEEFENSELTVRVISLDFAHCPRTKDKPTLLLVNV